MNRLLSQEIDRVIAQALAEDLGDEGDVTTRAVVRGGTLAEARLIAKADGVVAGLDIVERVFLAVDPDLIVRKHVADGSRVKPGDLLVEISGAGAGILMAERTALNILGRLSGIATKTAAFVEQTKGYPAKILDTRKTTPGLRHLEKYAVKTGGGTNHRLGLFDAILIKENHIRMAGGVETAIQRAKEASTLPVQVEVENLDQLAVAIKAGADSILLDNMTPAQTAEAVALARELSGGTCVLESSGGITIHNVRDYAATGVDRISIGALTHSVEALDVSLLFKHIS